MVNLERICKDIARITSDNVDPGGQSTFNSGKKVVGGEGGSIDGQLGKDLQRHCKDYP